MYTDVRLGIYQSQVADLFPGDCSGLDTIFEFMHHSLLVLSLSLTLRSTRIFRVGFACYYRTVACKFLRSLYVLSSHYHSSGIMRSVPTTCSVWYAMPFANSGVHRLYCAFFILAVHTAFSIPCGTLDFRSLCTSSCTDSRCRQLRRNLQWHRRGIRRRLL